MSYRIVRPQCECEGSTGAVALLGLPASRIRDPGSESPDRTAFLRVWRGARDVHERRLACPACGARVRVGLWAVGYPGAILQHQRRKAFLERLAPDARAAASAGGLREALPRVARRCPRCDGASLVEAADGRGAAWCPDCDGVGWVRPAPEDPPGRRA